MSGLAMYSLSRRWPSILNKEPSFFLIQEAATHFLFSTKHFILPPMFYEPGNTLCNNEAPGECFISIYRQYKEKIYQQAFHLTSCPDNAEDIVQDVFLNLWKQQHRWGEIENIQAYLFFCTRNKTLDYFQRAKLEKTHLQKWSKEQPLYDSPELKLEAKEIQKMHEEAVRRLPVQQKKVYSLRWLHGWKRKEIANALNLSDNTVKQHMQVADRSVREFMVKEMGDYGDHV